MLRVVAILILALALAPVTPGANSPTPLSALEAAARNRMTAKARVTLAAETPGLIEAIDSFEQPESGHIPNYLRALAARPGASKALAHLFRTVLWGGTVEPEVKMGMGLRIAQMNSSSYAAAHLLRLLRTSERGHAILAAIESGSFDSLPPGDRLALSYADLLAPDGNGVTDADFRNVRGYHNDSQIVELTLTVCFFNYFTRLTEGLNLPVEPWALDSPSQPRVPAYRHVLSRVPVFSDAQMAATSEADPALKEMRTKSTLNIANTERAMLWCPDIAHAWWAYGRAVRQAENVTRDIMLQVSFAVSMANNCHY